MGDREPTNEARHGAEDPRHGAEPQHPRQRRRAAAGKTPATARAVTATARTPPAAARAAEAAEGKGERRRSPPAPRREKAAPRRAEVFPELRPEAAQWEDFEGFRETFLVHFADPEHKVALRRLGQLLYALILEAPYPPPQPEGEGAWVRSHLGAALADLRFLQGFLGFVGQEGGDGGSARELTLLCQAAGRISRAVGREAERLEGALGQGGL